MRRSLAFLLWGMLCSYAVFAQTSDLDRSMQNIAQSVVTAYVSPVVSGFGANLNSAWFNRAPDAKLFGVDVEVGVVLMNSFFNNDNKTFSKQANLYLDRTEASDLATKYAGGNAQLKDSLINAIIAKQFTIKVEGPTIIGDNNKYVYALMGGQSVTANLPGGGTKTYTFVSDTVFTKASGGLSSFKTLPMGAFHLALGTIYGTKFSIRYLPTFTINNDLGEFKYFGFGIQHNPGKWLNLKLPVDLSLNFGTQKMDAGKYFSATATMYGISASKQFGPDKTNVTPYVGFSMESSKITVKYDYVMTGIPTPSSTTRIPISIEMTGENTSRFVIGSAFKFFALQLNVDYNISTYNTLSAGVNLVF